jgi:hypothetical protein
LHFAVLDIRQESSVHGVVLEAIAAAKKVLPVNYAELSETEKHEVENMLSTVISHWSVLKGTSPDGLREGFLIREGTLLHKDDDWFLQVERSAIDALLKDLSWTIGFIKLPWMKKMIRTYW